MHQRALLALLSGHALAFVMLVACSSDDGSPASTPPVDSGSTSPDTGSSTGPDASRIVVDLEPTDHRTVTSCSPVDAGPDGATGLCNADGECGASTPCDCDEHRCFTASNCRTDTDCATGQRCARSRIPGASYDPRTPVTSDGVATGYFCTTPEDDCACSRYIGEGYEPSESCAYNVTRSRWLCVVNP